MEEILNRIIKIKNNINLFKNMENEDIKKVLKNIKFIQFQSGETIIKEGDKGEAIFILLSGECRVTAGRRNVGILEKDQAFGEFSAISKTVRNATVRANKATTVISFEISFDIFEKDLKGFAILYKNFVDELIKKVDSTNIEKRKGNFV